MPLFGKKKDDKKDMEKKSYPTAAPAGSYPSQGAAYPQNAPAAAQYEPPPPYSAAAQQQYYPPYGAPQQVHQQPQYPPGYAAQAPPNTGYQTQYGGFQPQPAQTVVMPGGFDAGARFDMSGPRIPPPPPGCMPNAAQMAAQSGSNVVVTQRPSDWMTGGSDAGYVVW
ncbi:uncharacterized protein LOC141907658 isoform X2 [Tubulanus polymorphus]|uniref:uncharacterized protein LOC141907658 isoform X2 n=1 Tax=Tubulanus polymorphus TaxID=672921 RepID=UPI003DA33AB2